MLHHNPTSSLHFQGDTNYNRQAITPQGTCEALHPHQLESASTCETRKPFSIDHLPLEIIAEIFLLCTRGSWRRFQFERPFEPRCRRAPLLLCHICRYWRKVALSLPLLWCSLSGTGPFSSRPVFIELWLARSCGLPLSLSLAAPGYDDTAKCHPHVSKMFDLFSNEMYRWRTISFTLDNNLTRQFIATVDSKAQMLEELELVFEEPSSGTAEVSAVLRSFAKLRKLAWSGDLSVQSLRNMPFHALTHIYVASCNIAQDVVACLLQCTTALEIQWERVDCWDSPSVCGLPQITLHRLQSLNLAGIGDLAHILSWPTLPSLKYLCLDTSSKMRDHRLLEDFFDRSSCSLQHFILNDDYLDQESVVKYLTIPFLETIPNIYLGGSWDDDTLRRMQE